MALDGVPRRRGSHKTVEQLFHSENPTVWNASKLHDQEEEHLHHAKKLSILAKVKDSARKWRQIIVRKKHGRDANYTPSWGVALEDYEVDNEDTEPHGNPMHQSQHANRSFKDNERHSPTFNTMFVDRHNTSNVTNINSGGNLDLISPTRKSKIEPTLAKSHSNREAGTSSIPTLTVDETHQVKSSRNLDKEKVPVPSPSEIIPEAIIFDRGHDNKHKDVMHKLAHPSNSKTLQAESEKKRETPSHILSKDDHETEKPADQSLENVMKTMEESEEKSSTKMTAQTEAMTKATSNNIQGKSISSSKDDGEAWKWDKGVTMTEYLKCKLEPGEDERALSQVISEAISPRRSPTEKGVVEKMKTAVSLLLQSEEPSTSSSLKLQILPRTFPCPPMLTKLRKKIKGGFCKLTE